MIIQVVLLILVNVLLLIGCENDQTLRLQTPSNSLVGSIPTEYLKGESLFNAKCAPCHGQAAKGTNQGPPLVSKIYEPNHHGDPSFHRAVQQGVHAHHWKFGNMPRISGVSELEVNEIIAYVRWLQREAGIF